MNETYITISNKEIVNKRQLRKAFDELPDGRYLVKIERKNKRTSPQNRYLHLMFYMICAGFREIGYNEVKDAEMAKEIMKRMFLTRTIENGTGGRIEVVLRTRDLTKEQMSEFIEDCIQFSAENLGITIPAPEQQINIWEAEYDHDVNAILVR